VADPVVLYDIDEQVSAITLNRPDKLNAISADLQHQLQDAFARADDDRATSAVLLRAPQAAFFAPATISAPGSRATTTGAATR
jgi:enoyl-CoA hydratase/carnithine racemase